MQKEFEIGVIMNQKQFLFNEVKQLLQDKKTIKYLKTKEI